MAYYTQSKAKILAITIASIAVLAVAVWILFSLMGFIFRPQEDKQVTTEPTEQEEQRKLVDISLINEDVDYYIEVDKANDLSIEYKFREKGTDEDLNMRIEITSFWKSANITGAVVDSDDLVFVPNIDREKFVKENLGKYDLTIDALSEYRLLKPDSETDQAIILDSNLIDTFCTSDDFNKELLEENKAERGFDFRIKVFFNPVEDEKIQEYIDIIDNLQCN